MSDPSLNPNDAGAAAASTVDTPLDEPQADRPFATRHIGPNETERSRMLRTVGYESLDDLVDAAVPGAIRQLEPLLLPEAASEPEAIELLRRHAAENTVLTSMIGLGYYDTITPPVVQRNVLENPAWYTAYTPYQPEISQGRLEALLNFQTMVADLTGLPIANASMLDEGTAAAEAMTLARRGGRSKSHRFVVDRDCLPQTLAVVRTRARMLDIEIVVADLAHGLPEGDLFGLLLQLPGASGALRDPRAVIEEAHERGALVAVAADLLALSLITPPGELGADIAVGTSQRFGVPMAYGGPHAGYLAVRESLARSLPGRLVGVSVDADGTPSYRLALQTREQHIRREKATSNICTAQVLLAVMAAMYAVWHGPEGLRRIAERVHGHAVRLARGLRTRDVEIVHRHFFDTVLARVPERADAAVAAALAAGINVRRVDEHHVSISCDEVTTVAHVEAVLGAFEKVDAAEELVVPGRDNPVDRGFGSGGPGRTEGLGAPVERPGDWARALPDSMRRTSAYLEHPVFNTHRSETAMLRYLRSLADKDLALDRTMIPLGSCTMKLNATTEMVPITWPEFARLHPFAPVDQAAGTRALIAELESWLAEITGYDAVSIQPNAGSQGELAGLLAIDAYHDSRGDQGRRVCLIPASAHGTNAASAVMAGMRVVVVRTDDHGNIDLDDLHAKIEKHGSELAAIMVTYPSTHGVYEESISEVCAAVHDAGGQVYVDGANLNALVGLAQPGRFGSDVSHLNLHKTFCIPHGGGGPGVGPIGVREHLAPFLPNHPLVSEAGPATGVGPISAAPYGSAGILPISWAYIRMMGPDGLTEATETALLTANYVARRLSDHYPVLYTGRDGLVAHECILDLRGITRTTGVTVEDVAKRLIDYGFHAPTMSFPVAGTLMVEPTESEDLAELDRFCDAMIAIKAEIDRVGAGEWSADDNPLRGAPHTGRMIAGEWDRPYSREVAAYPLPSLVENKYWPPRRRIDSAYGDRNLVCSCPPPDAFE